MLPQSYPTVGTIAERCNEPTHRILYVLKSRGIQPSGRAGNARIYTEADVERIRAELARIDARKGGGVMASVLDEDVLGTAAAARDLNRRCPDPEDRHHTAIQVWRWMTAGAVSAAGVRVYLEHAKLGRKYVTSRQALSRFAAALARRHDDRGVPGVEDARADLAANGF